MRNPWLQLPEASPYVLPEDQLSIRELNSRASADPECKVNLNSLPEPFIGLPASASVVLLSLNPGDGLSDKVAHADEQFRHAIIRNLQHEDQDYPFYPLNPKFDWTGAGRWWNQRLRQLLERGKLDPATVARKLCVIEWFPYHSGKACFGLKRVCPSQDYSFNLAFSALRTKLVIVMRAANRWSEVHPKFAEVPSFANPRNPHVSPAGLGEELFHRVVAALGR